MNYFKLIRTTAEKAEDDFNVFFAEIENKNYRMMHTMYRMSEPVMGQIVIYGFFTYADKTHSH